MYLEQCNENQLKKLYENFNATEETIQRNVKTLLEWMEKQPHLPNIKDEDWLRLHLVRSKGSLERAKQRLELFYIFRAQNPEFTKYQYPTSIAFKKTYNMATCFLIPKLTPELNRVFVFRLNQPPSNELPTSEEYMQSGMAILTTMCLMVGICNRITMVIDHRHLTASMLPIVMSTTAIITPFIFKHAPIRLDKIYVLNSNVVTESIIFLLRKASKKLTEDRIVLWKKAEKDLAEVISKDCLPCEYGGTAGSYKELKESFYKEMLPWESILEEERKNVADLDKLPEDRKKTLTDMGEFGMDGSFRKLDLD